MDSSEAGLGYRKLSETEVAGALSTRNGWSIDDGLLSKSFSFERYEQGLIFGLAVGQIANRLNHHPTITIDYCRVSVLTMTHDVGGLTQLDFDLAEEIDRL